MTFTVGSVRSMKPGELSTAATSIAAQNDAFETSLVDVLASAEQAHISWTGIGGDAALTRAQQEVSWGRRIAGQVDSVVTALNDGAARLESSRSSLLTAVDGAIADGFSVSNRDWALTDMQGTEGDPKVAQARWNARLNHEALIGPRLATLVSEDEQVAFAIDAAIDETTATANDVTAGRAYQPPASLLGMSPEEVGGLIENPEFRVWVDNHPDAAKGLLDAAFDAGLIPQGSEFYRDFLRKFWQDEALEKAGIDPTKWDPRMGTEANQANITSVYEYYGQLFLDHPYMEWAGMANMIGPSFAGGFYDLEMLQGLANLAGALPVLLPLRNLTNRELAWWETKFLSMQKEIFYDQAGMHEAYLNGGMSEIDRMRRAGIIDAPTEGAWDDIDQGVRTGNSELIDKGNTRLLYREQHDIIADDYREMYDRPSVGRAMTYAITMVGAPSIPEAQSFAEVYPDEKTIEGRIGPVPYATTLTLPDGNIADFDDRWKLIREDTLTAYQAIVSSGSARGIIDSDFNDRLQEQRLLNQYDEIIDRLVDTWTPYSR